MDTETYAVNGVAAPSFWKAIEMAGKVALAGKDGVVYRYRPGQFDETQDMEIVAVVRGAGL